MPGFERDLAVDIVDFYNSSTFLRRGGRWERLDVPLDVNVDLHRQWLVLRPRTDWELDGTVYPAGSLLAADLEAFLAGGRELFTLFAPDAATSLQSWSWTRHMWAHDVHCGGEIGTQEALPNLRRWEMLGGFPRINYRGEVLRYAVSQ